MKSVYEVGSTLVMDINKVKDPITGAYRNDLSISGTLLGVDGVAPDISNNSPVSGQYTTVYVSKSYVLSGGTSIITVGSRDSNNFPLTTGGAVVALALSVPNGTISVPTDNEDGTYTAVFTANTVGVLSTISVMINEQAVTATKTIMTGVAVPIVPAGGYALTPPAQDISGRTILPVSTINIWVDDLSGNDVLSGAQAFPIKTLAELSNRLSNGTSFTVHLRSGGVWKEKFPAWKWGGLSAAAPGVVCSYGIGARPQIWTGGGNGIDLFLGGGVTAPINYVWFFDLDLYSDVRDYTNASGTYDSTANDGEGISWKVGGTGLHIENCRFRYHTLGIDIQGPNDVRIRRCVVTDSYQRSDNGHSQGIFVSGCNNLLIEENILDMNGWNGTTTNGARTDFNHGIYAGYTASNFTIRNNWISNSSNFAIKLASDAVHDLSNVLVYGNILFRNVNGINLKGSNNPAANYLFYNISITNNILCEQGGSIGGVAQQFGIYVNSADGLTVAGNYFINSTGGTATGGDSQGTRTLFNIDAYPNQNITWASTNVVSNWVGASLDNNALPASVTNNIANTPFNAAAWVHDLAAYDLAIGDTGNTTALIAMLRTQNDLAWNASLAAPAASMFVTGAPSSGPLPSVIDTVAALLPSPYPSGTVWTINSSGISNVTVNGVQVMTGFWSLNSSAQAFLYGTQVGGIDVGAQSSNTLVVVGNKSIVTRVFANGTAVFTYLPCGDVCLCEVKFTNSGGSPINALYFGGLNAIFNSVPVNTMVDQPAAWFQTTDTQGLDALWPSLPQQLGMWTMSNNAWGLGLGTLSETRSGFQTLYDANHATLTTRGINFLADAGPVAPGQTVTVNMAFRASNNTNPKYLMAPHQLWYNNLYPDTVGVHDARPIVSASGAQVVPATINPANPYNYSSGHRYDLDGSAGVTGIITAYVPGSVAAKSQGTIVWNLTGGDPVVHSVLVDPNSANLPVAVQNLLPELFAAYSGALLLLGTSSRPGATLTPGSTATGVLDYTNPGAVNAAVAVFSSLYARGFRMWYQDEFGRFWKHVAQQRLNRAATGNDARFFCEHPTSAMAVPGGFYVQINYINGVHNLNTLSAYTLSMIQWQFPNLMIVGDIRSSAPKLATTMEYLGQHRIIPMMADYTVSNTLFAAFYQRFIDPVTKWWRDVPIGAALDSTTPAISPPAAPSASLSFVFNYVPGSDGRYVGAFPAWLTANLTPGVEYTVQLNILAPDGTVRIVNKTLPAAAGSPP